MKERSVRIYLGMVLFSLAGTALSRFAHLDPGPIAPLTAALTLAAGIWTALGPWLSAAPARWRWLGVAAIVGAGAEVVGVVTGVPFGRYVYTDRWWPTVPLTPGSRFPLLVPFAWLLIAGASWASIPAQGWRRVLAAALIATSVDAAMEPVMAGPLGYWRWLEHGPLPGGAPIANSLGWFGVSAVAGIVFEAGVSERSQTTNHEPRILDSARWVIGGQLLLTLGLGILLRG